MFGNITDLPQIHSYEEALGHYAQIKPIRGSNNLRPICKTKNGRRKKHMEIVRRDDAVACRLYDTDVLTFFKDGTIEYNSGTWITNSTHSFASAILYPHVGFWTKQGHTEVSIGPTTTAGSYHIGPNQTIKDLVDGSNSWERLVPMLLETARVRRGNWVWETQTHEVTSYFDTQRIKDFISDVVKYAFADELFEERETSRRTFNKNAKYIWHKYKGDTD